MTSMPYAVEPRPDTGVSNATLGMWLFIASEVMLFGALFSAYVLLRTGAASWPDQSATLNVPLASGNTLLLILSSVLIARGATAASTGALERSRTLIAGTVLLGLVFLALKSFEYREELSAGLLPASNNFLGLYFTMTGLHALHVLAGVVVNAQLWMTGAGMGRTEPRRFASRVRMAALYWNFIDVIWIAMFVVLYLL